MTARYENAKLRQSAIRTAFAKLPTDQRAVIRVLGRTLTESIKVEHPKAVMGEGIALEIVGGVAMWLAQHEATP